MDVRSPNGTGIRRTHPAQDIAGTPKDLKCQPILTSASFQPLTFRLIFLLRILYPRHHHVESVHLTASGGRPLHPALAVVQTPSREYYILRDNGLEVGCEEEGVASVWMRILGCDARGEADGRAGVSFEELKAYIENL